MSLFTKPSWPGYGTKYFLTFCLIGFLRIVIEIQTLNFPKLLYKYSLANLVLGIIPQYEVSFIYHYYSGLCAILRDDWSFT